VAGRARAGPPGMRCLTYGRPSAELAIGMGGHAERADAPVTDVPAPGVTGRAGIAQAGLRLDAPGLLRLQSQAGNAAVARMLARGGISRTLARVCDPAVWGPDAPDFLCWAPGKTPASTPAAGQPVVTDIPVPDSVAFTLVVDDRKCSELTPDGNFNTIAELQRFAGALADEYQTRTTSDSVYGKTTRAKAQAALYDVARKAAATDADNQAKEGGLSKKDAAALKASMLKAVPQPGAAEVAGAVAGQRSDRLKALAASWDAHITSPQAAGLKVSTLANAWMRNRQQELLRDTEVLARAANQFNMFAKDALAGLDSYPLGLDKDASAGVDLATASGGVSGGPAGLVHPDTITFCNALHDAFSHVVFGTYNNHGSWPLASRGLSVDCTMSGRDAARKIDYGKQNADQFYERANVGELFDAIEATARQLDYRYFAIYNDYSVENYASGKATYGSIGFAANIDKGHHLNYHGGGLKLHVHLDLVPAKLRTG
jgi:hypothetical protein